LAACGSLENRLRRTVKRQEGTMIHELRRYRAAPGRMPDLLRRFDTITLKLFEKHGIRQVGFWTTEVGESNHNLFYMLAWDSVAARETKFSAFAADPEWAKARAETEANGQLVESISSQFLRPTKFSATQ
jgi:hypothetical protein